MLIANVSPETKATQSRTSDHAESNFLDFASILIIELKRVAED